MHDTDLTDLTAVARFASAAEARVACDYLSAHGVEALVMEQDRLRFDPLRPGKTPGVRVMVRASDESAARELLAAVEAADVTAANGDEP
jgi:hypothetical protein